jgi:hypothetical protein
VDAAKQSPDPTTWHTWSLEELARLTRLEADIRTDINRLGSLAADVHEIVMNAVDHDRSRGIKAAA